MEFFLSLIFISLVKVLVLDQQMCTAPENQSYLIYVRNKIFASKNLNQFLLMPKGYYICGFASFLSDFGDLSLVKEHIIQQEQSTRTFLPKEL